MVENLLSKVKSGMKKAVVKTIYTGLLVGTLLASTVMAQDVRVTGNYADQKQRPIPEAQVEYHRDGIAYSYATTDFSGGFQLWSPPLAIDPEIVITGGNYTSHNWAEPMVSMTQFYTQVMEHGTVTITNLRGQYVASAPLEGMQANFVQWGGRDAQGRPVASGFYNYTVSAGTYHQAGSLILLKDGTPTGGLVVDPQQYGSVQLPEKMIIDFQRKSSQDNFQRMQKRANQDIHVSENGTIYMNLQEHTGTSEEDYVEETGPDSVIFTKNNTTRLVYIMDPPEIPIDLGTINGNIGPEVSEIPLQQIPLGEIAQTNLNDYVNNDESTSIYSPRVEDFFMTNDSIVAFVGDMAGFYETWIDVVDSTDVALSDSVMYSVEVMDDITPTMDLPDTMSIDEDTEIETLIEDLRDYRTDTDTDEVDFDITDQSNPDLVNVGVTGYSMSISYLQANGFGFSALTVSITDGVSTSLDTMILQINEVNDLPTVVEQPPNYVTNQGEPFIIPAENFITDVDDILAYQLSVLSNASQEINGGQITVTPDAGFTGDITGVVLQGSDEEGTAETEPFNITVQPTPMSQLTVIQRNFYDQEPITSDTSWFYIRQLSPNEWSADSVYFSLDGVLDVELPIGDYEINTTAANTWDGAIWWAAESYLGLTREGDLKPFSKIGGQGGRCQFTLDQATDQIYANKVVFGFGLGNVVTYMGSAVIAFGDDAQDAPFVWDLNFDPPDAGELAWTNDYIAMIQSRQFNTLTMPVEQTSEIPTDPHTRDAVGIEFPSPGSNGTTYDETTYEIIECHARFAPSFSQYTYFIENIQAQYRMIDPGGVDPPVLQGDGSGGIELSEMGNQLVDFSDFWGAGYFVTLPALALYTENQIKDGNTDITAQIMGSEEYSTSMSATVRDFPGLTDYLKKFPIE